MRQVRIRSIALAKLSPSASLAGSRKVGEAKTRFGFCSMRQLQRNGHRDSRRSAAAQESDEVLRGHIGDVGPAVPRISFPGTGDQVLRQLHALARDGALLWRRQSELRLPLLMDRARRRVILSRGRVLHGHHPNMGRMRPQLEDGELQQLGEAWHAILSERSSSTFGQPKAVVEGALNKRSLEPTPSEVTPAAKHHYG